MIITLHKRVMIICQSACNRVYHVRKRRPILLCKDKRQYLLTWKVSRYCLLPLHGSYYFTKLPVTLR